MIFCCPHCHSDLTEREAAVQCPGCRRKFETVCGIPDLRVWGDSWIDFGEDLRTARELAVMDCTLEELVRSVYSRRDGWDQSRIARRTREVLAAPDRMVPEVNGWLRDASCAEGPLLDLGCGAGVLLAALAKTRGGGVGIDVSMTWLVVAKRLIEQHGGKPELAAAMGESLPLRDGAISAVVSLDVIEHVRAPGAYLREISRVVRPEGRLAISTPNRFSLTAEPHVFVWGVGWLPKPWQKGFVRWRSGKDYDDTVLMSSVELARKIRKNTDFDYRIVIPAVSEDHISQFTKSKALVARLYNQLIDFPLLRCAFMVVAPFFRVVGTRRPDGEPSYRTATKISAPVR